MDTPTTIGAFAAKTHLSELLEQVEAGNVVTITRRGRAVARLVPVEAANVDRAARAVERLRVLRQGATLGDVDWRVLRDEGRR